MDILVSLDTRSSNRRSRYKEALKLLNERKNTILLDIGCCFGNDVRKAVVHGWPVQNVIASDLRQGFWDYGHELFKSTPKTFPAAGRRHFRSRHARRGGAFLSASDIASASHEHTTPGLSILDTPPGRISAIHASSFFHLFSEERQLALAHLLASLLGPEAGSVIFGQQTARTGMGLRVEGISQAVLEELRESGKSAEEFSPFCHSPESWRELWVEDVFGGIDGKGEERVEVDAELCVLAIAEEGAGWGRF